MNAISSSAVLAGSRIPFSSESESRFSGRTVIRVENVYSDQTLKEANLAIDKHQQQNFHYRNSGNNLISVGLHMLYPNDKDICFDENGKVKSQEFLFKDMNPGLSGIKPMVVECVERMAKSLQWKSCSVNLFFRCIIYPLSSEQPTIKNMPWHTDQNTLTMTTVISSSCSGYTGGDISFACLDDHNYHFDGRLHSSVESTVQTFGYPENGGFIFDNVRSQHKVEDIHLATGSKAAERRLFSVFANPDKEYVSSLAEQFRPENIAFIPQNHTQEYNKAE